MAPWPPGVAREIRDELDSTNAEALRRAAAGDAGPRWILARRQTGARGRRGRAWAMPPGAFAATLLMRPYGPPAAAALRSFTAALALHDALAALTARPELFALKWPNDVLLRDRKLAGILLETGGAPSGPLALAVGFGVNLAAVPHLAALEPGALAPVSLRDGAGTDLDPEALLDALAPAFAAREAQLTAEGFAPVRAAWLARAARLGQPLQARTPARVIEGRFATIDAAGALVLETARGRVSVPAAEIHFPDDAPPSAHEPVDAARH